MYISILKHQTWTSKTAPQPSLTVSYDVIAIISKYDEGMDTSMNQQKIGHILTDYFRQ